MIAVTSFKGSFRKGMTERRRSAGSTEHIVDALQFYRVENGGPMSLNWDVSKVANYSEKFPDVGSGDDRQWNPTTMALVWVAIPAAWGWAITEENYREVFVRIHMYEHTRGAMRSDTGPDGKAQEVFFTLKEVHDHIGMSVNVSGESKTKFGSKLAKMIRQDAEAELKLQEKALESAEVAHA